MKSRGTAGRLSRGPESAAPAIRRRTGSGASAGPRRKARAAPRNPAAVEGFRERVYAWIRRIPRGRVATYGQIARALKLPGGARTAGRAMAACPRGVPWYRVLGAGGRLLTPEPYCTYQRQMLIREGVEFLGPRVNLARHQWSPGRVSTTKRRSSRLH